MPPTPTVQLGTARAAVVTDLLNRGVTHELAVAVSHNITDDQALAWEREAAEGSVQLVREVARKLFAMPYAGLVQKQPDPKGTPAALLAWLDDFQAALTDYAERDRATQRELANIKLDLAAFRRVLGVAP